MPAFITAVPLLRSALRPNTLHRRSRARPTTRFARAPHRRVTPCALGGGGGGGGEAFGSDTPDGMTLTQALELSFRTVWIQLFMGGVGPAYNEAIVGFVVASMAAYKAGYSIAALKFELSANEAATEQQLSQGGRSMALSEQEKETRLIWIMLVYLTLQSCGFASDRDVASVADQVADTPLQIMVPGLTDLVESIRRAERKGFTLETFKMELNVTQRTADNRDGATDDDAPASAAASTTDPVSDVGGVGTGSGEAGEEGKDGEKTDPVANAQASIRSQWSRIVFSALRIIPENKKGPRL